MYAVKTGVDHSARPGGGVLNVVIIRVAGHKHKIDEKFSRQSCLDPDPVCPERLDLDPVCPERLDPDPDPVNIRPDPQPWLGLKPGQRDAMSWHTR